MPCHQAGGEGMDMSFVAIAVARAGLSQVATA